jgi:short-subunit dehydrogenase
MMPLACLACRLEAGRAGATELKTWASQAVALELAHTDVSYREVCSGLAVSAFSDMKQQDVPRLNWWLMSGDTDFL